MQAGLGDLTLYSDVVLQRCMHPSTVNDLAFVVLGSDHVCGLHSVVPELDFF